MSTKRTIARGARKNANLALRKDELKRKSELRKWKKETLAGLVNLAEDVKTKILEIVRGTRNVKDSTKAADIRIAKIKEAK